MNCISVCNDASCFQREYKYIVDLHALFRNDYQQCGHVAIFLPYYNM